jgi:hypothetical protein
MRQPTAGPMAHCATRNRVFTLRTSLGQLPRGTAMVRSAVSSIIVTACLLSLAACDADEPAPSAASPTQATSSSPVEPIVPRYLVDYSEDEREAYDDAVVAYEAFADRNAELVRKGRATSEAREYYQRATAGWQSYWARLMDFDSRGIRVIGRADVGRIRPAAIKLDEKGGGQVDIRVCSIAAGVRVIQDGQPMPQPSPKPTVTKVSMVKLPSGSSWRILSDRAGGSC